MAFLTCLSASRFYPFFLLASVLLVAAALVGAGASAEEIRDEPDVVAEDIELASARGILVDLAITASVEDDWVLGRASAALRCWTTAGGTDVADVCRQVFWTAVDDLRAETDVGAPPVRPGEDSAGLAQMRKEAAEAEAKRSKEIGTQVFTVPFEGLDALGPVGKMVIADAVARTGGAPTLAEVAGATPRVSYVAEALRREGLTVVEETEEPAGGQRGVIVTFRPYRTLALVLPPRQ
jgi:hypothetical protein